MFFKKKQVITSIAPLVIFLFSFSINQYFGNRGVFPIDSFSHFDLGFRVLNGEHPFKDYWSVSGPIVDYLQGLIFLIFDVNWQTYLLNASILNGILSVATYKLFASFNLKKSYCFFYAICFSILAYPSSATPFVDHHSVFFSLIAIYFLIYALRDEKKIYWFFIPVFLLMAFLSKQVPSTYVFISILVIIFYHFTLNNKRKNLETFLVLLISSFICLVLLLVFLNIQKIDFQSFLIQYIRFPQEIGGIRYEELKYGIKNIFFDFKFIHFSFFLLLLLNVKKISKLNGFYKKINFKLFLIFFLLIVSLIHHQILSKNQIFIFFLIPLLLAFTQIELTNYNIKFKNIFTFLLIFICLFTTYKYHVRFNLDRKFHELSKIDISNSLDATMISQKLKGLKWITPDNNNKKKLINEIDSINKIKNVLEEDKNKKMILTNFSFFSVLLDQSSNTPSRWFPENNSTFPTKGSKFYSYYKNFLISQIKKKNIDSIYIIYDVSEKNLFNYIDPKCFDQIIATEVFSKYIINKNCAYLSGK